MALHIWHLPAATLSLVLPVEEAWSLEPFLERRPDERRISIARFPLPGRMMAGSVACDRHLRSTVFENPDDAGPEPESLPVNDGIPLLRHRQRHQAKELQSGIHGEDNPRMHEDARRAAFR